MTQTQRKIVERIRDWHRDTLGVDSAADALTALLAATETPSGWQPIETAPKDGTPFLAWEDGVSIVQWIVREGRWVQEFDGVGVARPTHWMPLPEPPRYERDTGMLEAS